MGIFEALLTSVAETISKSVGRKQVVCIACMGFLYVMEAPTWQVFGIGCGGLGTQFLLDAIERILLHKDLPENGETNEATPH